MRGQSRLLVLKIVRLKQGPARQKHPMYHGDFQKVSEISGLAGFVTLGF